MSQTVDKYYYHHLTISESEEKQREVADEILKRISQPRIKGVILYFHGGLSSLSYMREDLALQCLVMKF